MTLDELVQLSRVRDRFDGVGISRNTKRNLEGYCYLVVTSLQEALNSARNGQPAKYTGREDVKTLTGRGDRSGEDEEPYTPTPGDPVGYGSHIAEAFVVLAALCRAHRIPIDALLERRVGKYRGKK